MLLLFHISPYARRKRVPQESRNKNGITGNALNRVAFHASLSHPFLPCAALLLLRGMSRVCVILVLFASFLVSGRAAAHTRSVSYSSWRVSGSSATVRLRLARLDLDALQNSPLAGGSLGAVSGYLQARLRLLAGAEDCLPVSDSLQRPPSPQGWKIYQWRLRCSALPTLIRSDLLVDLIPKHLHLTRVLLQDGKTETEGVLNEGNRELRLPRSPPSSWRNFLRFVLLGIEHIWSGWDHLVFLLALLLGATSMGRLATVITGFTVGHSLTLGLAAMDQLQPDPAAIEALIGLSIALVAVENVWLAQGRRDFRLPGATVLILGIASVATCFGGNVAPLTLLGAAIFAGFYFGLLLRRRHPDRLRVLVTALFGLVHGFGFAGALKDLELSRSHLLPGLLGFNGGVEIGQLVVIAGIWPLLAWSRKMGRARGAELLGALPSGPKSGSPVDQASSGGRGEVAPKAPSGADGSRTQPGKRSGGESDWVAEPCTHGENPVGIRWEPEFRGDLVLEVGSALALLAGSGWFFGRTFG